MIFCSSRPESFLKAALLSELTGLPAELRIPGKQKGLFDAEESLDADTHSLPALMTRLSLETGRDYDWINQYPGRRLFLMILFNLRNRSSNCGPVILEALTEAVKHGPGFCLCGRGRNGKLFCRRSREVGSEIHRMLGLVRFAETVDGDLVARPILFHDTADILLRKFQLRYPNRRLVFVFENEALCCWQGRVHRMKMQDLPPSLLNLEDDFTKLWETYYRSQYIPARKNIRLASHFIPRKYWDWLPEGKILEQEAKK